MPNVNINRKVVLSQNNVLQPPPISGYSFWFRADGLIAGSNNKYGIADATGSVSQWSDLGGSSIVATQLTGSKQPVLQNNIIGTKLRKAINFTSANFTDFTIPNAVSLTNNIGSITMYIVSKVTIGGATAIPLYFSTNAAGSSRCDIRSISTDTWQLSGRRLDTDGLQTVAGNSSTSAYKVITGVIDYVNSNGYEYENGSLINSNTSFSTDGSTSATNSAVVNIGSSNGGNVLNGYIGEVLVYVGQAHSDIQVSSVSAWLNNFYGIY